MAYRSKTYVIFEQHDAQAYSIVRRWARSERLPYLFYDAHDLPTRRSAFFDDDRLRSAVEERMLPARQVLLLLGSTTRYALGITYWEIECAVHRALPIIVANLNDNHHLDVDRCPPKLLHRRAMHIAFRLPVIDYALATFPLELASQLYPAAAPRSYAEAVYNQLRHRR